MKIFLIGYMASGKTLLGTMLAKNLEISFYDLDQYIVQCNGQSIEKIFRDEGEASFRQKENLALQSMSTKKNAIISCGGGTFTFPANRDWIHQHGISIYLKVEPKTLAIRLSGKEEKRPIIKANNASQKDLEEFIESHLKTRQEHYEQANIIYLAESQPKEIIADLACYFRRFILE